MLGKNNECMTTPGHKIGKKWKPEGVVYSTINQDGKTESDAAA